MENTNESSVNKPQIWVMDTAAMPVKTSATATFGTNATIIFGSSATLTWNLSGGYSSASISYYGALSPSSGSLKTYSVQNIPRWFSTSPAPGDHMCSPSNPGGYAQEGTLFKSFTTQAPGTFLGYDAESSVKPQATIGYVYPFNSSNHPVGVTTIYEKIDPNGGPPNGFGTIWTQSAAGEGPYTANGPNSGFKAPTSGYSVDTDIVFNGSATVSPADTTTYTLSASGSAGSVSLTVTITVLQIPATITYFRANDNSPTHDCYEGDLITLEWSTFFSTYESASSATIDQGIGAVSVGKDKTYSLIAPTENITYTLTIVGKYDGLTVQKSVTLNILTPDSTPDPYAFSSVSDAEISQFYESNIITVSGLEVLVDAFSTNGSELRLNGGAWTSNTITGIDNQDTLQVRMSSSASFETKKTASINISDTSATWNITTKSEPAQIPNAIIFNDLVEAPLQSYVQSNEVNVTGITVSVPVSSPSNSISGFESRVDDGTGYGPWSTDPKTIANGQKLQLRYFTSNILGDEKNTSITVGDGAPTTWSVTNQTVSDSVADYFEFIDAIDQPPSTPIDSNSITITGINVPTTVSASDGSALLSIDGGAYAVSPQTITNNQTLSVRLTSSPDPGGQVETNITIGNSVIESLSDIWTVTTTTSGDIIPDPFYFIDKDDQVPNTYVESNTILIQGITSPSPFIVANGQASINGGPWVFTGNVSNEDTVKLRMLSAATVDTDKTVSITIG